MLTFDPVAHAYYWGGQRVPNVTSVLESVGLTDFSGVNAEVMALAQARGKAVHRACELHDNDDLDESTVDPEIVGYLAAWRRFRRETHHEWENIEKRAYHPRYRYAGTADRTGKLFGNPALVDIKTGVPQPATGAQTAAYANLHWPPGDAERKVHRYAVHLGASGMYHLIEYKDRTDFGVFLSALTIFNWLGNHGNR